ncbi:hypothetical protein B0H13DRAFT_2306672 [Mycena leptocephala]|nr:hypothetical protein B0H13DRAFT_2306672 [Mycena leptocephala]
MNTFGAGKSVLSPPMRRKIGPHHAADREPPLARRIDLNASQMHRIAARGAQPEVPSDEVVNAQSRTHANREALKAPSYANIRVRNIGKASP